MITNFGYIKAAACSFDVCLGNPYENAKKIIENINIASSKNVNLLVFPELCITGYTCADMFLRSELIKASIKALNLILEKTKGIDMLICIGMPIENDGKLFNCALYIYDNEIIGIVPKTYIPNYSEFYEKRWFVSSKVKNKDYVIINDKKVPFSEDLIINCGNDIKIGTEICEDLWVDDPPSGRLSKMGANIIVNPSASNDIIGKREYRKSLVIMQSARLRSGYIYASAGEGESSTDLVFSGHLMIADNGRLISEDNDTLITGLIDVERCLNDRKRYSLDNWDGNIKGYEVDINLTIDNVLPCEVDRFPFVPKADTELKSRCFDILNLQIKGLMQRLKATKMDKVVLGISGGLDSTLALIVCAETFDRLNIDRKNIYAITMPGFGTSTKTKSIADNLLKSFKVTGKEIDITNACKIHMQDLEHREDVYDIAYENIQARERTQILFDYSNMVNGLVIGTGDMSELALGWCTYNGDHMSNYGVNTSVPKTLVKYIIREYALLSNDDNIKDLLLDICDLPISPELLPTDENGNIAQKTEEKIGKYDLHDFFLYHFLRNGFSYEKIYALSKIAFSDVDENEIKSTLDIFYHRFRTQQFKRSCIPDGVKVGTVSLSPRGDLRMPSDLSLLL